MAPASEPPTKPAEARSMKAAMGRWLKPREDRLRGMSMSGAVRALSQNSKSKRRVHFAPLAGDQAEAKGKLWFNWWMDHGGGYVLKVKTRSGVAAVRPCRTIRIILPSHGSTCASASRGCGVGGDTLTFYVYVRRWARWRRWSARGGSYSRSRYGSRCWMR
jgi:hypothetical protein